MTKMGKCKNIDIFGNSTFYLFMYVRIKPHQKVCKIKPTRCTCTHTLIELKCLQKRKLSFFTLLNYSFFGNILKEISFCLTEKYVTSFLPFSLHNYISWIVFYFSCRRIPSSIWWILTSHETFDNIIIIKYLDDIAWILNFAMLPIHVWK